MTRRRVAAGVAAAYVVAMVLPLVVKVVTEARRSRRLGKEAR